MKLTEMTNKDFSKLLASDSSAPGGGSAAALASSLGAALTHMVACLTVGKPKYAEHEALAKAVMEETETLRAGLLECMDKDTEIFAQMSAVFEMPKSTDKEKEMRKNAMQEALKACTVTPFEIMALSLKGLEIAEKCVGKTNASAASDLGVSALNLKAGLQGAWLNVLINISSVKDEGFVKEYNEKCKQVLDKALPLADGIFNKVKDSL